MDEIRIKSITVRFPRFGVFFYQILWLVHVKTKEVVKL